MSAKPGEVSPGDAGVAPRWSSVLTPDGVSLQNNRVQPPAAAMDAGFGPFRQKPPRNWLNWLLYQLDLWRSYYDQTNQRGATVKVAAGNGLNVNPDSRRQADYRCDGTADEVEIQAAIDAVSGFGGGVVLLSEGVFNVNAPVRVRTNVTLRGSDATTLQPSVTLADGLNVIENFTPAGGDSRIRIEHLAVGGSTAGAAFGHVGIRLQNCDRCRISDVLVSSMQRNGAADVGDGIRLDTVTDSLVERSRLASNENHGIRVTGASTRLVVDRCQFEGNADAGLFSTDSPIWNGIRVSCCAFNQNLGTGQVQWGLGGTAFSELSFDGGGTLGAGLRIKGGQGYTVASSVFHNLRLWGIQVTSSASRVLITACEILNVNLTGDGIAVTGGAVEIENCFIEDTEGNGIAVSAGAGFGSIRGCHILSASLSGVRITSVDQYRVLDCEIRSSSRHGIYLDTARHVRVQGNHVFQSNVSAGAFSDIKLEGSTSCQVQDNECENTGAAPRGQYAVHLGANGGAVNSVAIVAHNDLRAGSLVGNTGVAIQVDAGSSASALPTTATVTDANRQI